MEDLEILEALVPFDLSRLSQDAEKQFNTHKFKAQNWLGGLEQQIYGRPECPYKNLGLLPNSHLRDTGIYILKKYWLNQDIVPTVSYLQRTTGQAVKRHRDPKTDKDFTTILYFGDFTERVFNIEGRAVTLKPGMLLKLRCTVDKVQGPYHWVSEHKGTCWSFIMNRAVSK